MPRAQHYRVFQDMSVRCTHVNNHQGFKGALAPFVRTAPNLGVTMNSRALGITVCEIKLTFSNMHLWGIHIFLSFSSHGFKLSGAHVFRVVFGKRGC